jgi:ribosomal protein S18 acetylase RimI-like enzyme
MVADMLPSVEIVPVAHDHIESFHRSLDVVARERRYLAFLEAPPFDETRAFVLNNIERGYPQLVAVSAGEVVGWCDVIPNPRPIFAHVGLLGIALLPGFRRQGLGRRLIRQTLDAARVYGLHRVELTVRESNTGAIELYKEFGFAVEGLQRNRIRVDGAYENQMVMGLLF